MKCTVIGIAGGTGSGKSTFTARIKAAFPDKVAVLYHDNYYKAHDNIPFEERKTINYDHPNSLETDLLIEHVKSLKMISRLMLQHMILRSIPEQRQHYILNPNQLLLLKVFSLCKM